jgi:single-strand DNA-binding protein
MAILLGRVGKKDTKVLKNGGDLTTLSLATSKKIKDASGVYTEITTWHMVNCFSKLAEIANKYVKVGDIVFIQGEIQNKKIESGERAGQFVYSVHASDLKFIPKNRSDSEPKKQQSEQKTQFQDDEMPEF